MKNSNENIALYLPFNGLNGATTAKDYSVNDYVPVFKGGAQISNTGFYRPEMQSSLKLDGDDDEICVEHSSTADFFSDYFTIEITFYVSTAGQSNNTVIMSKQVDAADNPCPIAILQMAGTYDIKLFMSQSATWDIVSGALIGTVLPNTWNTLRVVRAGSKVFCYLNKQINSVTDIGTATLLSNNTPLWLGSGHYPSTYLTGYIQEILIVNGEAWNDWAFNNSVTTGQINLDDYRQYLTASYPLTESSGDAIDVINGYNLTDNGGVGSTENFRGELARDFDGSDDYLSKNSFSGIEFSTGNFLISFFAETTDTEAWAGYMAYRDAVGLGTWDIEFNWDTYSDVNFYYYDGNHQNIRTGISVIDGSYHHICVCRLSGILYIYVDNVLGASQALNLDITSSGSSLTLARDEANNNYIKCSISYLNIYKDITFTDDTERNAFVSTLYNEGRANVIELSQQRNDGTFVSAKQYAQRFYNPILDSYSNYMVAYWNGEDIYDRAKHHTLTNNNGVTFEDNTFNLNGSSSYLTTTYDTAFNWTPVSTMSMWCYIITHKDKNDGNANSPLQVGNMNYNDGTNYWSFGSNSNGNVKLYYYNNNPIVVAGTTSITLNTWVHLAMTCDGTTIKLYVNGTEDASSTLQGTPLFSNSVPLTIGACDSQYYHGKIKDLMIDHNVAMTADEVSSLYNNGVGKYLTYNPALNRPYPAEHLVDVWALDEASGNRLSLKNGYEATDYGSVGSASGIGKTHSALFDGTNYLSIANATYDMASLLATNTWTIGFWYKSSETANKSIMGCRNASDYGFDVQVNTTQGYLDILVNNSSQLSADIECDDDTRKRIVITCSNSLLKLYINKELIATQTNCSPISNATIAFYLGGLNVSGTLTNGFAGQLQEFMLLDTPVDISFIEDDYNNGAGRFYVPAIPANALLNEDGSVALWEDGSIQVQE